MQIRCKNCGAVFTNPQSLSFQQLNAQKHCTRCGVSDFGPVGGAAQSGPAPVVGAAAGAALGAALGGPPGAVIGGLIGLLIGVKNGG